MFNIFPKQKLLQVLPLLYNNFPVLENNVQLIL